MTSGLDPSPHHHPVSSTQYEYLTRKQLTEAFPPHHPLLGRAGRASFQSMLYFPSIMGVACLLGHKVCPSDLPPLPTDGQDVLYSRVSSFPSKSSAVIRLVLQ